MDEMVCFSARRRGWQRICTLDAVASLEIAHRFLTYRKRSNRHLNTDIDDPIFPHAIVSPSFLLEPKPVNSGICLS